MDFKIAAKHQDRLVTLSGPFTFADNQKFRQLIEQTNDAGVQSITLDFAGVDFIDSAGLGMLLLFRDSCQEKHIPVTIQSAKGQVEKIFLLSKFDQLFAMQKATGS